MTFLESVLQFFFVGVAIVSSGACVWFNSFRTINFCLWIAGLCVAGLSLLYRQEFLALVLFVVIHMQTLFFHFQSSHLSKKQNRFPVPLVITQFFMSVVFFVLICIGLGQREVHFEGAGQTGIRSFSEILSEKYSLGLFLVALILLVSIIGTGMMNREKQE